MLGTEFWPQYNRNFFNIFDIIGFEGFFFFFFSMFRIVIYLNLIGTLIMCMVYISMLAHGTTLNGSKGILSSTHIFDQIGQEILSSTYCTKACLDVMIAL